MKPQQRRALGLVVLAIVLAVGCIFAGRWQWNRHVARDAVIATIEANYDAEPVALDTVLPGPGVPLATEDVWTRATADGHYEPDGTVLLRNRPVDGQPGYHVLVPFVVDGTVGNDGGSAGDGAADPGTVLVIDRGWVPTDSDAEQPSSIPSPPAGDVTVTVHLRKDEPASRRDAPAGQVQAISVEQVLAAGGGVTGDAPTFDAYGAMESEQPAATDVIGALPEPDTDPGSHLSYAFQWWTFALGALVGFSILARRELQEEEADRSSGPGDGPPRPAPPTKTRRRPSAEDEEDALIDAQLG